MNVVVSFDADYGADNDVGLSDAFWLVESPANRLTANKAWALGQADENSAVFRLEPDAAPEAQAMAVFDDVELHHPLWTEVLFVGVSLTPSMAREIADQGHVAVELNDGFAIRR